MQKRTEPENREDDGVHPLSRILTKLQKGLRIGSGALV